MNIDITPALRRQAVREVMEEVDKDLSWFSDQIGFHVLTVRAWMGRLGIDARNIDRAVDAFLGRYEDQQRKKRIPKASHTLNRRGRPPQRNDGFKTCPRCAETKAKQDFYGNGYCKPCGRELARIYQQKRKAASA